MRTPSQIQASMPRGEKRSGGVRQMPPGEFEDRQQVKREQQVMHARNKVKVYAVLMALLWAGAIPINVIVARQNPWAVLVIAGTGLALLIYWLRVGGQVSFSRPRPLRFHVGSRIRAAKGTAA